MPQLSTPLGDLIARLAYHTTKGQTPARLLAAFNFDPMPVTEVDGPKDLPSVRVYVPDVSGDYRPSRNESTAMKFRLTVSTKRKDGLVAHMQAVEKVMDALNFAAATPLVVSPCAGTTKPWSWSTGDNFILDLSVNSEVTITLEPKVVELGKRRL